MNLITAIRRERVKAESQVSKLQAQINGLRQAENALQPVKLPHVPVPAVKVKRVISIEGRKAMSIAQKRRWARIHKAA